MAEFEISDHFEPEIFFLRKKLSNITWKKFYKAKKVLGITKNGEPFPEYDILTADKNNKILQKIEVKAQQLLYLELCEVQANNPEPKQPSGLSQCLADFYYFFKTSGTTAETIDAIRRNQSITYDLYIVSKDDLIRYLNDDKLSNEQIKINIRQLDDMYERQKKLEETDPLWREIEDEYNELNEKTDQLKKDLYFYEFKRLNNTKIDAKTGNYAKNTGWGVGLVSSNFELHKALSNQQSIPKNVKSGLIKTVKKLKNLPVITGPDTKPNNLQPCGVVIDNNLLEPYKWFPSNINNTIDTNKEVEVEEYAIPVGYGKDSDSDSSSSSSSDDGSCRKIYNRLKRNIDKKYKGKKDKYL